MATNRDPALVDTLGGPAVVAQGLAEAAEAFAATFMVAAVLVSLTMVPALFLPRKHEESHLLDDQPAAPVVLH